MSAPTQVEASTKKVAAKKPASEKPKATHPKYADMIAEAIKKLAERSGSSKQAICKYIMANHNIDEKVCNQHTKVALKSGVKSGMLKQTSGTGASGSFKIGEAAKTKEKAAEKKAKEAAKPKKVAKPAKKAPVKKATKPAAKKAVTKKDAKPAAKAKTATKKVVKIVIKKVAAKPVAKKPAVKKPAATKPKAAKAKA